MSGAGPGVDPFERDVLASGGYRYTTEAPLSSRLANDRITDASLASAEWGGRRVIDLGCGDGTYTAELLALGHPASIHGVEPSPAAVATAQGRGPDARMTFAEGSAYELPHADDEFDLAYLRGVLHHMDTPVDALSEALRVAPMIVVVEPNGYNVGLKVLEKVSPYHRQHAEKSYTSRTLDRWIERVGGTVVARRFVGFVPFFCPDGYARLAKRLEPVLEGQGGVRQVMCAQYAFAAARRSALGRFARSGAAGL